MLPMAPAGGLHPGTARFYVATVVAAFRHLHDELGWIFRDLKLENIIVHSDGYTKLADFGLAKEIPYPDPNWDASKPGAPAECPMKHFTYTMCGSSDYMPPEIVLNKGHNKCVDYWGLGAFLYELLIGTTPFASATDEKIYKKVLNSEKYLWFPPQVPASGIDICKELMEPNPQRRLGMGRGGAKDVMLHPFFSDTFDHPDDMHDPFTWDAYLFKQMHPPVTPPAFQPYSADSVEPTPEYDGEDVGCFITWDK